MPLDYQSIMSGRRKDPLAVVMRGLLRVASIPYGIASRRRNKRYDSESLPIYRSQAVVISVGNLTTGGTGKTPIVCFLAKWFRQRGTQVAIVSRGYGRGDADANDEALELNDRIPGVPHVQDPDRVEAARIAVEELEAKVILMDDGFQHRRLHRDMNIVVIDATCPFGYGYLLPRGLLRESVSGLARADVVILTRSDAVPESELAHIEAIVQGLNRDVEIIRSVHQPTSLLEYPGTYTAVESLRDRNIAVLCAIGNPTAFEDTVRSCGATIVDSLHLSDHNPYAPETVAEIDDWIRSLDDRIDQVVCTHKDLVKLKTDRLGGKAIAAVVIDLTILNGRESLEQALLKLLPDVDDVG